MQIARYTERFIEWHVAILHALLISVGVAGLFFYWFAVADRYAIFLYNHLNAGPFDPITVSRYLMAGPVASGFVLVIYVLGNWAAGRIAAWRGTPYQPPHWWQVWSLCSLPLLLSVTVITATQNTPVLPWPLALACAGTTLTGLALALPPGSLAAVAPWRLAWLFAAGLGIAPVLLLMRVLELSGLGLHVPPAGYVLAYGGMAAGAIWLLVVSRLARRFGRNPLPPVAVFLAGAAIAWLLLPLAHYLFFTPAEFRYITAAGNFFAESLPVQALSVGVAGALAGQVTRIRKER